MTLELIRVLVVDDDVMQLELIERTLSRDGFEVRGATTLVELAAAAKTLSPHIVLMDINMPGVPSEQTIATARDAASSARVVLYSAWEESRLRGLAAQLKADGFISKSESVVALGKRLRELHG
jgi:two-component system OmpR family response regulator